MTKPLVVSARANPTDEVGGRQFAEAVDHAIMIADAALAVPVFDMQMLRDGYLVRGALNRLRSLQGGHHDLAIQNSVILEAFEPVLEGILDAEDRFTARLPTLAGVRGIEGRTFIERRPAPTAD